MAMEASKDHAEEFVRTCISRTLGVPVHAHDDGSRQSMYDLEIRYPDRRAAPVEVTSDVDQRVASTLGTLHKMYDQNAWVALSLQLNWSLQAIQNPNLKQLKRHAETQLRALELAGLTEFESQQYGWPGDSEEVTVAVQTLARCGVERAHSARAPEVAQIWVHTTLGGGAWDGSAECIVQWINDFTADPHCADNLGKLAVPGATEGHLAVYAHMSAVPWGVWRALIDHHGSGVVPQGPPTLPLPITHLWLFPAPGDSTGMAYDPVVGWYRFETPEIEQVGS
ncbi:hypothetical protein [Streptacidiphilus sp. EB129]|uniref:hypothetical protein n=1 Tax=Streptacidiphilus sp. EB129 TaxID=3156262 RepID=UPI003515C0A7